MLNRFKHINFLKSRIVSGVEARIDQPGAIQYSYTQLKNYYGNVSIKKYLESVENVEELEAQIGKKKSIPFAPNRPVILNVTGKQVLIKKIEEAHEDDDALLLQKTLPGARISDFYLQRFYQENEVFVAVIKQSVLDELFDQLKSVGFYVIKIVLGPFAAVPFLPQLVRDGMVKLPGYSIRMKGEEIDSILPTPSGAEPMVVIDGMEMPFNCISGFTVAHSFFEPDHELEELEESFIETEKTEVKFGIYQVALLRLFFVVVIFMSGTSHFLTTSYEDALMELSDVSSEQSNTYQIYQIKQQELVGRINLLNNTGVSGRTNLSFFADRIGVLTPKSIRLLEMEIVPVVKKLKEDEKVELDPTVIFIEGVAPNSLDLNEWLSKLDEEDWIEETTLVNYSQTNKEYPGIFELVIQLNG